MATAKKTYKYTEEQAALLARLKRIEGQAKGIQEMVESGRYCIDIVQQLTALSSAANEVAMIVLEKHIEGCVSDAIREEHGEEHVKELMKTIRKAIRR